MWNFSKYKNKTALIDDKGVVCTYRQLDEKCKSFSENISGRPLIFIVCENTIKCIIAYVSCVMNKHPAMLVDKNMMSERYEQLLKDYKPEYVYKNGELIRIGYKTDCDINDELALLMSTSGSTGSSKQVKISYSNLISNTRDIVTALDIGEADRAVTSLPMNYCYGLSVINSHLMAGATILVTNEKLVSRKFWDFVISEKMTTFAGVPYTYDVLRVMKIFDRKDISFKKLTSSGGRLSDDMESFLRLYCNQNGVNLYLMYGQTEATARMSCMKVKGDEKKGSSGKAVRLGKFEILLEDGRKAEPYEKGRITYRGENVFMGYAHSVDDLSLRDENNGMLDTKDEGYMDEEGYIYVFGRTDRIVKIQGVRISLNHVEECMRERFEKSYRVCFEEGALYIKAEKFIGGEIEYVSELTGLNKRGIINRKEDRNYRKE